MADDYLDPRVNVVSSDADVDRVRAADAREGRKVSYAPADGGPLGQQYVDAIKGFEGFTPRAQWDVNNHRNGYGTNALYPTETIDKDEAHRRLTNELGSASALVDGQFPGLPEGHRAALTSLTFNAGPKWMGQGLGNAVRNGDWDTAKQLLLGYNHSAGSVNAGLTKRRAAEAAWLDGASPGPMDAALNSGDVTGSVPQGRRQMPSPMDDAMSPGILDRITNGLQTAQNNGVGDTLQNVGAWLMARDNPAGGAALLKTLGDDRLLKSQKYTVGHDALGRLLMVDQRRGTVTYPQGQSGGDNSGLLDTPEAQKKLADAQAKNSEDLGKSLMEGHQAAIESQARAKRMLELIDSGKITFGTGADQATAIKNIPGMNMITSGGPEGAELQKLMAGATADWGSSQKGMRLMGPEIKFSSAANPSLDKPQETNRQIVTDLIAKYEYPIQANKLAQDYKARHGYLDAGFQQQLSKLRESFPGMGENQFAGSAAPSAQGSPQQQTTGAPQAQPQQTATNPKTGERLGLINGQWVPLGK